MSGQQANAETDTCTKSLSQHSVSPLQLRACWLLHSKREYLFWGVYNLPILITIWLKLEITNLLSDVNFKVEYVI